jgi:ketosteroid isomerase-like protein
MAERDRAQTAGTEPPQSPGAAENLEAAIRLKDLYEREGPIGVLERYDEHFHPEAVWEPAISSFGAEDYVGREGMRRWIDDMEAVATEYTQIIEEVRPVGERHVLALGKMRIVGKESGLPVEADYAQLWEVDAGRMTSMRAYLTHVEAESAARRTARAGQGAGAGNADVVREFWTLFNDDSFPELLSRYEDFFTEDLEWNSPVSAVAGRQVEGRAGFERHIADVAESFVGVEADPQEIIEIAPGLLRCDVLMRGEGPSSGATVDSPLVAFARLRDARIHWLWASFDLEAAERQAGVLAGDEGGEP